MAVNSNKNKYGIVPSLRLGERFLVPALLALFVIVLPGAAHAQEVEDIVENVVTNTEELPGLVTVFSYLLGLLLGISGILKLKEHVENPNNVPLRTPLIRLLIGGALFSLPIVYEAMYNLIMDGDDAVYTRDSSVSSFVSGLLGYLSWSFLPNVNGILAGITESINESPALITAIAYLLGLVFGVGGLIKTKEHVENPDQVKMREPVIRFIAGGAFFALPAVYQAMADIVGDSSLWGGILGAAGGISLILSEWGGLDVGGSVLSCIGLGVGASICQTILGAGAFPAFLAALSYVIGLIMGFWAILKIKEHVEDPQRTAIWEGISRLMACGLFLSLPLTTEILRTTLTPIAAVAQRGVQFGFITAGGWGAGTGWNETTGGSCDGLDGMLGCMMSDVLGPMHLALNMFAYTAGMILIMIGISRLTKSVQDGARGPGGVGTFMTFVTGGLLMSYNEIIRAFTFTFFPTTFGLTQTYAELSYTTGMTSTELEHAHTVITAVMKFLLLIGLISFVRGLFIIRDVAEGNGQASLMSGVTHLVGGALAVNLGPLMNAVQTTLGITGYGIAFSV